MPTLEIRCTLRKVVSANMANKRQFSGVLLATALVKAKDVNDGTKDLRALIDPRFQTSFISLKAANMLGLKKNKTLASISGIGGVHAGTIGKTVSVSI